MSGALHAIGTTADILQMTRLKGLSRSDRASSARVAAALCAAIGATSLVGWAFDLSVLSAVVPGYVDMKANTALCLVLCGMALLILASRAASPLQMLAQTLSILAGTFALATLLEYSFSWDFGIDELIVRDSGDTFNAIFRGRMSPYTAAALTTAAAALSVLPYARWRRAVRWAGACTVGIALFTLVGYAWDAADIVTNKWLPPVALTTAVCLALLGAGIMAFPGGTNDVLAPKTMAFAAVEAKILLGFLLAMVLLVAGSTYTYRADVKFARSIEWVAHTQEVRASLATLYGSLAGAEVALRDYVRTADGSREKDYRRLISSVQEQMTELQRLTLDNAAQRANFTALARTVAARLAAMEGVGVAYRNFGLEAARALIGLSRNANSTRDVGELTDRMRAVAERQLTERRAAGEAARHTTLISLLGTLTVAAALFTGLFRAIHREMRARREAEQALQASDGYNRSILDSSPDCLSVLSLDGRVEILTPQGCRLLEVDDVAAVKGLDWVEIWKGEDRREAMAALAAARGGNDGRFRGYCPTLKGMPKWWDVIVKPVLGAHGRPQQLLAVARDISEVKRTESALLETNRFLDSLIESLPLMVIVKDAKTLNFVRANRAAEQLIGKPRERLIGRTARDILGPAEGDVIDAQDREALRLGRLVETPEHHVHSDHLGARVLHVMKMPLGEQAGTPRYLLAISVDITERKLAEQAIHELNSALQAKAEQLTTTNSELESFSYSVSHDLRAPLRAIDGFALMLEEDHAASLDAQAQHYLKVIRDNARRMGALIDDLLAFSRLGRLQVATQEIDMEMLVREVVAETSSTSNKPATHIHIGALPPARGDRALLRQVWTNLIANAVKYSAKSEMPRIAVSGARTADENLYSIADNGVGFDMQYADKLFGVFQRLHRADEFGGTGVGLAIVQRIVNRHRGRVWAEGRVGEGAVFFLSHSRVDPMETDGTPHAIRVLLVEDRPEDAELLVAEMRRRGLAVTSRRVDSERDYEEALGDFHPDLILSDYTLPGFDGPRALQIAQRRRPDTPFVFVSGTIGEERAIEALRQGAVDYVLKDNRARLVPAVERALKDAAEREVRRTALRKLEASEERFRSIAEATQDWIWEIDPQGHYTFSSPAVEAILGYKPSDLLGRNCLDILSPDNRATVAELLRRGAAESSGWRDLTLHFNHARKGVRWLDNNALPLTDESGALLGYRGVARDITQRRLQQERIARLSRIQAVLSGINSTIVRVRDRHELFREACRIAVQQGGFRMAWVGTVEPGAMRATPLVWEGINEGYLDEVTGALDDSGREEDPGSVGKAIRYKKMVVARDLETDPHTVFKREALARGFRSLIAMPLIVADEVAGVLVLYAGEAGFFDLEELRLLKDLAGDISFALDYIGKEERLTYVSYYDTLTGLPNRQLFFDRLAQSLNAARAESRELAVVIIDLQRFKQVNDTLGRHAGDQVLKIIANRLERTTAESAMPARIGADRFGVVVHNLPGPAMPRWIEEWIVDAFAAPLVIDDIELRPSVKVGIALYPADADTAETLFVNAEAALKRAKDAADPYLFYSPGMNARVAQRLHLESRLRKAVLEKQFLLHYQTKVNLATRQVRGLEALLRWRDPEHGLVSPMEFVPLLEESGLIVDVGRWVIEQAVADIREWRNLGLLVPRVAVNVSEVQLRHPNFVATVFAALGSAAAHDGGIDIEITESMVAQNAGNNVQKLSLLRAAGLQVFMDDFGTGYSGLSQIAHLPLDALKIDRAFVADMTDSTEHMAIVSAIVNLAKALGLFVVAEGVETEEQASRLQELGCDEAQGYLFSKPLPAAEVARFLIST